MLIFVVVDVVDDLVKVWLIDSLLTWGHIIGISIGINDELVSGRGVRECKEERLMS